MADTNTLSKADVQDAKKPPTETKGNSTTGFSQTDVAALLKQYGYNEITENKRQPLLNFLSKFWELTAWMLEFIPAKYELPSKLVRLALFKLFIFKSLVVYLLSRFRNFDNSDRSLKFRHAQS
jgi:magnesium-transporting ATPase (P-type)